jgi:hypothetical protein
MTKTVVVEVVGMAAATLPVDPNVEEPGTDASTERDALGLGVPTTEDAPTTTEVGEEPENWVEAELLLATTDGDCITEVGADATNDTVVVRGALFAPTADALNVAPDQTTSQLSALQPLGADEQTRRPFVVRTGKP